MSVCPVAPLFLCHVNDFTIQFAVFTYPFGDTHKSTQPFESSTLALRAKDFSIHQNLIIV